MKKHLLLILLSTSLTSLFGQFGLRSGLSNYQTSFNSHESSDLGFDVALHYWFRHRNLRIEFFPEVSYGFFQHADRSFDGDSQFKGQQIGASLPIRIYPLDLTSDCDCPTFSKQNDLFKKGFFISISPGYFYGKPSPILETDTFEPGNGSTGTWEGYFGAGFGLGLDIGLSDLVTITPGIQYVVFPLNENILQPLLESELKFGFTATFRPDY